MLEQNKKINSIVLLRAIAALAVCFIHIQMATGFQINPFFDYLFINGQQGVVIFFVISGFILPYSLFKKQYQIKNFFGFILKRSVRVDPPYWCCIILLFILVPLPLSALNLKSIFLHLAYLVPFIKSVNWYSGIFWTLSIEFQFYIILGLLYPVLMWLQNYISVLIVIFLSVLSIKYNINGIIISNVYQFAFGYIAFMAYVKLIDRKWFWIIFLLFTTYIIFAKSIISGVVPASAVSFLMLYKRNTNVPVLNFLGNISYSLYLMHIPISAIAIRTLSGSLKNTGLLFLICLILSILIAYIFYLLIERPALNLSKRINLRKR